MSATSERLKRFLDTRIGLVTEHRALMDAMTVDGHEISAEERASDDRYNQRFDDLDRMIEAETRNLERERQGAANDDTLGDDSRRGAYAEQRTALTRDVRDWLRGSHANPFEIRHGMGASGGTMADYLTELRSGDDIEQRALSVGTASAGGNLVAQAFADKLYEHMIEDGQFIREVTLLTTATGESFTQPKTTTHPTGAAVAEGGTIAQSDPVFGKLTLGAYKYANLVLVSRELVEDDSFDLLGYLARIMGRAIGNVFAAKLVTGAGSTEPRGVTIDSTLGVTGATTGVSGLFTADELIDLEYSVIESYALRAKFLCRRATAGRMRKLKDTAGQYLWAASVQPGLRDTFDGQAIIQDPTVAAVATSAKSVLFGDYSTYVARIVRGVRFERSDDFKFDADQIAFRAVIRGDGGLADLTGSVKHYIGAAT